MGFTSLNHHIDLHWLHEAYLRTRKDGAVGVDGQTAADYEANLWENRQSLLDGHRPTCRRAKSGTYQAPPGARCGGCTSRRERVVTVPLPPHRDPDV